MTEQMLNLLKRFGMAMDKGTELRDLDIRELSGVDSAANGYEGWLLMKAANGPGEIVDEHGHDADDYGVMVELLKVAFPGIEDAPEHERARILDAVAEDPELLEEPLHKAALDELLTAGGEEDMSDYQDLTGEPSPEEVVEMLKSLFPGIATMTVEEAAQFCKYLDENPEIVEQAYERELRKAAANAEVGDLSIANAGYSKVTIDPSDVLPGEVRD